MIFSLSISPRFLLPGLLALCLCGCGQSTQENEEGSIDTFGKILPKMSLMDLKAEPVEFSPASGKVTVLNVWGTWCPPCRQEMPSLQKLSDKLDSSKYQVVGIAMDDDNHLVTEFLLERGVEFTNMLDFGTVVTTTVIGVESVPMTLIIDDEGRVRDVILGGRDWDSDSLLQRIQKVAPKEG